MAPISRSRRRLPRGDTAGAGMPAMVVRNLQRSIPVDCAKLQVFAGRAVALVRSSAEKTSSLHELLEIAVLLISDRRMAGLHRRFLALDGPTDVITFQHGEIFISAETAAENARRFRVTVRREIELYLVHGLLHLAGYEDKSPGQAAVMRRKQTLIARQARGRPAGSG